jgi:3'-5' exonuclease
MNPATCYLRTAAGHELTVHAPRCGELDPATLATFVAAEPVLGLDVETSALDDHAPRFFAPGFTVRLMQLGSEREAWVLDMADPRQRDAAAAVLADPARRFVTHTSFDVLAVWVTLGIPLGQRVADTHLLSKLIDPDERAGHGLKELSARHLDDGWPTRKRRCTRGCGRRPRPGTGPGTRRCGGAGTTCPPTMRLTLCTPGWTPSTPAACCRFC